MNGEATHLTRELLERYLRGDAEAERALFASQRGALSQRAAQHLKQPGLARVASADDLIDEVFLRALGSGLLTKFQDRGRGSLARTLADVLDKVVVDTWRRHGAAKRGAHLLRGGSDALAAEPEARRQPLLGGGDTPTAQARAAELLCLCRDHLTAREWQVWRRSVVLGRTSSEIARELDSSDAAIRAVLMRARVRLVAAVAEQLAHLR